MLAEHLRRAARAAREQAAAFDAAADELETSVRDDGPYTSLSLPPDCPSRERFRRLAAVIRREQGEAAAQRIGQVWHVKRDAWAKHRGVAVASNVVEKTDTDGDGVDAADALARAGLRVVGGRKP